VVSSAAHLPALLVGHDGGWQAA